MMKKLNIAGRLQVNRRRYTTDELNARLRFYVGIMLALTVFGSTMAIIYAVTFVTQPLGEVQSENDKAFFTLLSTTVSFLVGVISGFMLNGTSAAGKPIEGEEA
jgi:cytochrome bd-type quinol oxidase subunit 1